MTQIIEQGCLPLIRAPGTDPKSVAKPLGLKETRDGYQLKEKGVGTFVVRLPNSVNPSACEINVTYDPGLTPAIVGNLAAWAAAQPAPLQQDKVGEQSQEWDGLYTTTNWVGWSASTRMGLAFAERKKLDGTPVVKNQEQARVAFSFRAVTAQDRTAQ